MAASNGYPSSNGDPLAPSAEVPAAAPGSGVPAAEHSPEGGASPAAFFAIHDDDDVTEEPELQEHHSPTGPVSAAAAADWYALEEQDAEALYKHARQVTPPGAQATSKGSRLGPLWSSASKLGKKATQIGSKARKALVEEAKLVVEDAKDLADGVREGLHMTASDTKALGEKLASSASVKGWRGLLGTKIRGWGQSSEAAEPPEGAEAASSSSAPSRQAPDPGAESRLAGPLVAFAHLEAFEALRAGLATTAEVSKEVWKDFQEVNQEMVSEVRQSVDDLRQALQERAGATAILADHSEDAGRGLAGSEVAVSVEEHEPNKSPRDENSQASSAAVRLKSVAAATLQVSEVLWRKTAGGLSTIRKRLPTAPRGPDEVQELSQFWGLPSARANYVHLVLQEPEAELQLPPRKAAEAVQRVRKLGGRLAKKVSSGIMRQARDLSQNLQQAGSASPLRSWPGNFGMSAEPGTVEVEQDSIFEIGSDGDDAWSEEEGLSEGYGSETPTLGSTAASSAGPGKEVTEHIERG